MNKEKFVEILNSLKIPVDEGIQKDKNNNADPRIVFWDFVWSPNIASGKKYTDTVTYQVSFFSLKPRHPKLIELKKSFEKEKIYPTIEHEFVEKDRCWHSFFAVEVLEDIK